MYRFSFYCVHVFLYFICIITIVMNKYVQYRTMHTRRAVKTAVFRHHIAQWSVITVRRLPVRMTQVQDRGQSNAQRSSSSCSQCMRPMLDRGCVAPVSTC